MEHPAHWARIVVVLEEVNAEKMPIKTRQYSYGIEHNTDILGTLATAQFELFEFMKGRR